MTGAASLGGAATLETRLRDKSGKDIEQEKKRRQRNRWPAKNEETHP
jgi:hypothetical protein